jgi:hypothetical protein
MARAESVSEPFQTWNGVIAGIKDIGIERTQTEWDKGQWLNRVEKVTIKRDGLGWRIVQTLKQKVV